jgi:hypothetical protein
MLEEELELLLLEWLEGEDKLLTDEIELGELELEDKELEELESDDTLEEDGEELLELSTSYHSAHCMSDFSLHPQALIANS